MGEWFLNFSNSNLNFLKNHPSSTRLRSRTQVLRLYKSLCYGEREVKHKKNLAQEHKNGQRLLKWKQQVDNFA